jgi:hypothetical protein
VPLLVAGIGVLGTLAGGLGGVLIAQRRADKREDKTWERERAREHERWRREDIARTFEHRREACVDFYGSLCLARDEIRGGDYSPPAGEERVDELGEVLFKQLATLSLYASPHLTACAEKAVETLGNLSWSMRSDDGTRPSRAEAVSKHLAAEDKVVRLIRQELSVPSSSTSPVAPTHAGDQAEASKDGT